MPHRGWKLGVHDILDAVSAIQDYTQDMDYEAFTSDRKTVDTVVRNFIVLGEAACHIPEEIYLKFSAIPWHEMRGMRNFVVHEYFGVSNRILWDTIQTELPPLIPILRRILEEA